VAAYTMVRILIQSIFIAFFLVVSSCAEDETSRNTIEYFETHLNEDMSHSKMLLVFGKPDKDLGSGIHIYVYTLEDSTEVWVGITDKILYANHVDKDQNLLKVLI
jgi:hypothetical protein